MEDTAAPTPVMVSNPQHEEHLAVGQETTTPTKLGDEISQCTYFQAQDRAGCSLGEDQKCAENTSNPPSNAPHTEDNRSHKEGTEHEDPSTSNKAEGAGLPENPYHEQQGRSTENKRDAQASACCPAHSLKPDEETICQTEPESTPSEAQSSHLLDDLAEKKLAMCFVEETLQLDGKPKELSESGVGEECPGAEATSILEDNHAKEGSITSLQEHEENKVELSSQSQDNEPLEATKDNFEHVETVKSAEYPDTEIPVITVESASTTQLDNIAESSASNTEDAPGCQKEHDDSVHPAEGGARDGAEELPEGDEQGPTIATQEDPMKVAEEPEDVKSSEGQDRADNAETKREAGSGCHKAPLTQGAQEEKGVLHM